VRTLCDAAGFSSTLSGPSPPDRFCPMQKPRAARPPGGPLLLSVDCQRTRALLSGRLRLRIIYACFRLVKRQWLLYIPPECLAGRKFHVVPISSQRVTMVVQRVPEVLQPVKEVWQGLREVVQGLRRVWRLVRDPAQGVPAGSHGVRGGSHGLNDPAHRLKTLSDRLKTRGHRLRAAPGRPGGRVGCLTIVDSPGKTGRYRPRCVFWKMRGERR
jgi:hypothetical protein